MSGTALLIVSGGAVLLIFLLVNLYGTNYSLDKIKDKTVGHGQHGVARSCLNRRNGEREKIFRKNKVL